MLTDDSAPNEPLLKSDLSMERLFGDEVVDIAVGAGLDPAAAHAHDDARPSEQEIRRWSGRGLLVDALADLDPARRTPATPGGPARSHSREDRATAGGRSPLRREPWNYLGANGACWRRPIPAPRIAEKPPYFLSVKVISTVTRTGHRFPVLASGLELPLMAASIASCPGRIPCPASASICDVRDVSRFTDDHLHPHRALDLVLHRRRRVFRLDLLDDLRERHPVAGLVTYDCACEGGEHREPVDGDDGDRRDTRDQRSRDSDNARQRDMEPSSAMSEMRWLSVRRPMNGVTPMTCGCGFGKREQRFGVGAAIAGHAGS